MSSTAGKMIETGRSPANPPKKPSLTPKAIIHQRFGDKACYKVEEVQDSTQSGCPGLAIRQKGPCLYRCTLDLPETTVVSDTFRRKKDAEQSAAEKAIEKLGIRQKEYNPTVQEAWNDLAVRVAFLFTSEFLSSIHPLSGHFRAALTREDHLNGCIPVSAIAVYDTRITNICNYIDSAAEGNSLLVMSLVGAAAKLTDSVLICDEQLSLKRRNPYPPEDISSINLGSNLGQSNPIEIIRIPASLEKAVEPFTLNITATGYYLDFIARELGIMEASGVLISRTVGKASSEMRIYSSAPKKHVFHHLSESGVNQEASHFEGSLNARASYLTGQEVYGDAILASVGYTWKSTDLFHEAVSLRSYYRLLVNKIPEGVYKISRDAILAAKLPSAFTTKGCWRGSFPRDMLCTFCRFHHLPEPVFSTQSNSSDSSLDLPGSHKKLKVTQLSNEKKSAAGLTTASGDSVGSPGAFNCEIKMYSGQELILQCSPQESHKKQTDAIQSAALKVLSWLNIFFEKPEVPGEKLNLLAEKLDIHFNHDCLFKVFALCYSVHNFGSTSSQDCGDNAEEDEPSFIEIGVENSGVTSSNGSLASVSHTVSSFREGDYMKEHLESCEEFEFEKGNEAVLPNLEAAVAQVAVGQSAYVHVEFGSTKSQDCGDNAEKDEPSFIEIGSENSGVTPSNGSLASISYTVSLFREGDYMKEHLESCEEFEFEMGNGAVLPNLEAAVAQMAVGQSAYFQVELPPDEYILAAAGDSAATLSLLSSRSCKLEYCVTLLQVTEPLEERMEQALFSPPLSKQRVEFALQHIKESSAASLVDFGCGSGSLLDSLLSYPTSLEKIVGVDISTRSLAKAAKSLHTKLNGLMDSKEPRCTIKSAVLYDGSILKFDSQLRGFDIATCLEVIEHMEEEEACLFGDIALSSFCPKILIVSTPNYEYNVILQGSTPHNQGDDPDEKNQQQSCKFRNHDHKFEWTRAQFEHWASELAVKHSYGVEFSGVGGAGDVEPGFASQIAIFRRLEDNLANVELAEHYVPIWEWSREDIPIKEP